MIRQSESERDLEVAFAESHSGRRLSIDREAGRTGSTGPISISPNSTCIPASSGAVPPSLPIRIKRPAGSSSTPSLVLPTIDGYTVSHSLLVDNIPTDSYGFMLDERFGISSLAYRNFEKAYAAKCERQVQRWAGIVPLEKGDLVIFPPSNEKIKRALRKGLPKSLRARAWYYYSGAQALHEQEPKRYVELVKLASLADNAPLCSQIESDISHTFANNRTFRLLPVVSPFGSAPSANLAEEPASHAALRRILLAVAHAYPSVSYATGLNVVAGTLLLVTQDEVRSFWIMCCILERLLPANYYTDMNLGCNVDLEVLSALIAWKLPEIHARLQKLDISLHILTSTWFTHLFVDQLPFETLLRLWDCFLHEGSKVLFRVALALFKLNQSTITAIEDSFELAAFIRNMPRRQLDIISLMEMAFNGIGGLSSSWLAEERARLLPSWRAKHAVRRFSRVSPAYCQAPASSRSFSLPSNPAQFAPLVIASRDQIAPAIPSQTPLRLALDDCQAETLFFERPQEMIDDCALSQLTLDSEADDDEEEQEQ